jgi:copper chaperone CopZ
MAIVSVEDLSAEALPVLTAALQSIAGVQKIDFNLERSVVVIEFDSDRASLEELQRAILRTGFKLA